MRGIAPDSAIIHLGDEHSVLYFHFEGNIPQISRQAETTALHLNRMEYGQQSD